MAFLPILRISAYMWEKKNGNENYKILENKFKNKDTEPTQRKL